MSQGESEQSRGGVRGPNSMQTSQELVEASFYPLEQPQDSTSRAAR